MTDDFDKIFLIFSRIVIGISSLSDLQFSASGLFYRKKWRTDWNRSKYKVRTDFF